MRILHVGLLMLLAVPLACAPAAPAQAAQSQDELAAAARKAREQQKERPKAGKVWDNDNIPTAGGVDVVGPSPAPAAAPAKPEKPATKESAEAAEKKSAEKKSDLDAQLKSAKDNLKNLQEDLDIAQRKYALDQQSFYQNPNYSSDAAGAAALKDEENQIQSKKDAVEAAQKKVDDLQAKIKAAGNSSETSESK